MWTVIENLLPFMVLMSVVVFVHEWGHFFVARRNGVVVTDFAIGFGPSIFGWTDSKGTRWRFNILPLGGYVKMLGDADATSATADQNILNSLSAEQKNQTLSSKTPWQRIQVAAAGPLANFIFAILAMWLMFSTIGIPRVEPLISTVDTKGAAYKAGLRDKDRILSIDGKSLSDFNDLRKFLSVTQLEKISVIIMRDAATLGIEIPLIINDDKGEKKWVRTLGIKADKLSYTPVGVLQAAVSAYQLFLDNCKQILMGLKQLVTGERQGKELGGILSIGHMASQSVKQGVGAVLWFMIIISINLGLLNLFPIPVLDGGQIFMNAIEWVIGKPLSERVQQIIYGAGFAAVITLMLYSTWNDLTRYSVISTITKWLGL